jgi:signal transduction histidine kinase
MARLVFFCFLLIFIFLNSSAQDKIEWINYQTLESSGFYQNLGLTKEKKNIGLIFTNNTNFTKQFILKVNNPHVNDIYLYKINGDTIYHTGDHKKFYTRPIIYWDYALPITLPKKSTDSIVLSLDKRGENLTYFLEIQSPEMFDKFKTRDTFMYGMLLSFSIFFTLIFFILGIVKKDSTNIIFSIFIFISAFSILNSAGLGFQFIWPSSPWFQNFSRTLFAAFSMVSFIQYMYTAQKINLKKIEKIFLKFGIGFFIFRVIYIAVNKEIYYVPNLKLFLLYLNASIIICIMIILLVLLVRNIILFKEKLNNLGLLVFFLFPFKEGLRQLGIDVEPHPEYDEYITTLYYLFPIALISLSNVQTYRKDKKATTIQALENAHKKDLEITEKILNAQEYERSSIGKNIHDQVGGLLSILKVKAQILKRKKQDEEITEELDHMINILNVCNDELHNIVDDLIPPELANNKLSDTIRNRIEMFSSSTEIIFNFKSNINHVIDETISLNIYRIICELTTNSIRHSGCSEIHIELMENINHYYIRYLDNGIGLNIGASDIKHGIKNIRSRIDFLSGKIDLNAEAGKTEFIIEIPIAKI